MFIPPSYIRDRLAGLSARSRRPVDCRETTDASEAESELCSSARCLWYLSSSSAPVHSLDMPSVQLDRPRVKRLLPMRRYTARSRRRRQTV
jgi:hypothetical protein